jgi:elongation factor 1-beta
MAGIVAVIVKILPDSPDANLEEIKSLVSKELESQGSKNISIEEEPIAFGLSALNIKFAWPEEKNTDLIENSLSKIPHVNSVKIEDYRRAFG